MASRSRRAGTTLGIAGAGLILGHWLTYVLVTPGEAARQSVLERTGHGYLPFLGHVLFLVAMAAVVLIVGTALVRREGSGRVREIFPLLAAVQILAFGTMEVGERLVAGSGLADLTGILPLGFVIQIAIAAVGAVVVVLLARAAADVAAALAEALAPWATRPGRGVASILPGAAVLPASSFDPSAAGIRGPPSR